MPPHVARRLKSKIIFSGMDLDLHKVIQPILMERGFDWVSNLRKGTPKTVCHSRRAPLVVNMDTKQLFFTNVIERYMHDERTALILNAGKATVKELVMSIDGELAEYKKRSDKAQRDWDIAEGIRLSAELAERATMIPPSFIRLVPMPVPVRFCSFDTDRNQGRVVHLGDFLVIVTNEPTQITRCDGCCSREIVTETLKTVTVGGRTFKCDTTFNARPGDPELTVTLPHDFNPFKKVPPVKCPACDRAF